MGEWSTHICDIDTPAFVYDAAKLQVLARRTSQAAADCGARFLYSVKSLSLLSGLNELKSFVDGFSVSSLFEARLASDVLCSGALVQYVSPILRQSELAEINDLCGRITLNSFEQFDRFEAEITGDSKLGIRLNPGKSFVKDARHDPSRRDSKLGVSLEVLVRETSKSSCRFDQMTGLHLHSNCDSDDLNQLVMTIKHLRSCLGDRLSQFHWVNLGGGYDFANGSGKNLLQAELETLSTKYEIEIVIEPGASIVRPAGCFVATVEDIIEGHDYPVAILDLTINHWPEIFEYQFEPDVEGHVDDGDYTYVLAGCSCLAGDVFGEYSFIEPLEIGSRLVFPNAGAYSIVKSHMFNGINLPNIYVLTETGELVLVKKFTYDDFLARNGVDVNACFGT
jgi:carboxynorspermidine decarboxylase